MVSIRQKGEKVFSRELPLLLLPHQSINLTLSFFQLLTGNRDRNTIVRHRFARPRRARYVRVVPYTWHRHISMRVELYGRRLGKSSFILLSRQARIRLPLYIC